MIFGETGAFKGPRFFMLQFEMPRKLNGERRIDKAKDVGSIPTRGASKSEKQIDISLLEDFYEPQ